jgi:hypothetical protein
MVIPATSVVIRNLGSNKAYQTTFETLVKWRVHILISSMSEQNMFLRGLLSGQGLIARVE